MDEKLDHLLSGVAMEVLEKLAFLFSFREQDAESVPVDSCRRVSVGFGGLFSGTLMLSISRPILPELAANMLGEEESEVTSNQQDDALKELANIVCGNMLPAIAGRQAVFSIHAPEIVEAEAAVFQGKGPAATAWLSLDNGSCSLFLYTDEPLSALECCAEPEQTDR